MGAVVSLVFHNLDEHPYVQQRAVSMDSLRSGFKDLEHTRTGYLLACWSSE